ncbi:MAG: arylesterase [Acidobacteria bacterium]|nr:arylesterase [Acidobacteriota bacterium]
MRYEKLGDSNTVTTTVTSRFSYLTSHMRMRIGIRNSLVAGSIFLALLLSACGTQKPSANHARLNKPLATPPSAGNKPKVICFGDSLSAGFGLSEKESYPYLLQQQLTADGYDYEVVNAGVSGDTSAGGLDRADWVLGQDNAKVVVIELGANDMLRGMPPSKMKQNIDKILTKAQTRGLRVLLCGMLAPPTMGAEYQRDFTNAFPDLASEHHVAYLPFLLDNVAMNKDLNQADGIHPNAAGEKIMTDNVYRSLKPLL